MIDKELIQKKLVEISEYLDEIKPIAEIFSVEEILSDNFKFHTAERLFQLIVDTCVDINTHIIKSKEAIIPDDFQSTFIIIAGLGAIDKVFAEKIAPVVGLRNRIVHRYDTLNRKLFIENLRKEYSDFKEFLKQINEFIK